MVSGNEHGRGFRDLELEQKVLKLTRNVGIGAQFGGKYFCHDVRVIRLPRHGASCPVGIGVSCSADRQVKLYHFVLFFFLECDTICVECGVCSTFSLIFVICKIIGKCRI